MNPIGQTFELYDFVQLSKKKKCRKIVDAAVLAYTRQERSSRSPSLSEKMTLTETFLNNF